MFISGDDDAGLFNEYRSIMPWSAVPLDCNEVTTCGIDAMTSWNREEKFAALSVDEHVWMFVACDGCSQDPLVGRRFGCGTCRNYDLCAVSKRKGHEHQLTLVAPSDNDDEAKREHILHSVLDDRTPYRNNVSQPTITQHSFRDDMIVEASV